MLRNTAHSNDIVARLGRDEFVILSVENDEAGVVEVLLSRLIQALTQEKIAAAIGVAMRHPAQGLFKAAAEADRRMFEHKRQLKSEA